MREINPTPRPVKQTTNPPGWWAFLRLPLPRSCCKAQESVDACCARNLAALAPRGRILPGEKVSLVSPTTLPPPRPAEDQKTTTTTKTPRPECFLRPQFPISWPCPVGEDSRMKTRTRETSKLWGALGEVSGEICSRWKPQPGL